MGAVAVLAVIVACDIVDKPNIFVPRSVEFFFAKEPVSERNKKILHRLVLDRFVPAVDFQPH